VWSRVDEPVRPSLPLRPLAGRSDRILLSLLENAAPTPAFHRESHMTKADLVEEVADAIGPGVTKRDCALIVDGFLGAVKQALARGENIEIRGFGTFKVRRRKSSRSPERAYRVVSPRHGCHPQAAVAIQGPSGLQPLTDAI
jgi:nucleoid DNA-binding protein